MTYEEMRQPQQYTKEEQARLDKMLAPQGSNYQ